MADRYLVTARKYRPAVFSDLVAQDHVSDTLKNAIRLDRLAHAYLFSGPRGVGKTTAARILAKAINCETPLEERPDKAEPCCECDSCRSFAEGRSLNIFEIDAASNNKVDDIRELRESVRIPPQGSQKKVYIIDEVHMLSNAAFNALLKTLEEPPPHVLFIFATTEPHKVLPTILSRCQRFDFRRIPVPRIVKRLRYICENEGIEADEESLMLIARKGDGALRDALSAFDQAVSLCGKTLTYSELAQALGVVDRDLFFQLVDHVANNDSGGVLRLVQNVMSTGYDLQEFLAGLTEHLRHLLVAYTLGPEALSDIAESARPRYVESSNRFSEADLLRLLMIVGDAETEVKQSSQPRLKLELALLNMAHLSRAGDLQDALNQLSTLEAHAENGTLPTTASSTTSSQEEAKADSAPPTDTSSESISATEHSSPQAKGNGSTPSSASTTSSEEPAARTTPPPRGEQEDVEEPASQEPTVDRPASQSTSSKEDVPDEAVSDEAPTEEATEEPSEESVPEELAEQASSENETKNETPDGGGPPVGKPSSDTSSGSDPAPSGASAEGDDHGYHDLFNPPALSEDDNDSTSGDGAPRNTAQEATIPDSSFPGGAEPTVVTEPTTDTDARVLHRVADVWSAYVERVKQERRGVGSLLGEAEPTVYTNGTLRVAVPKRLHRETLLDKQRILLAHLPDALQEEIDRIEIDVRAETPDTASTSNNEPADPRAQMKALREKYDGLNTLFTMFGAEPVW